MNASEIKNTIDNMLKMDALEYKWLVTHLLEYDCPEVSFLHFNGYPEGYQCRITVFSDKVILNGARVHRFGNECELQFALRDLMRFESYPCAEQVLKEMKEELGKFAAFIEHSE